MKNKLVSFNSPPISKNERKISRFLLFFEDIIKVPLFGCQRCGECILSSTAFICSQNCPKRLRNGPCGGTGVNGECEVYPEKKCVWYKIYYRAKLLNRISSLYQIKKIHNWNLEQTSAWLNVLKKRIDPPVWFVRNDIKKIQEILSNDFERKD